MSLPRLSRYLNEFNEIYLQLERHSDFAVEQTAAFTMGIKPKNLLKLSEKADTIGLTLMGLTHGSEVVGVGILNRFARLILENHINLQMPIYLVLGNLDAAKQGVRFIERDLNRSFGLTGETSDFIEEKRAKTLEPILSRSAYFLDFHQTIQPSFYPFFIFPYNKKSFNFATSIGINHKIVTHWGRPFSSQGMCSDEFVNRSGGVGITFETGQCGMEATQIAFGIDLCLQALSFATKKWHDSTSEINLQSKEDGGLELFTFSHIETAQPGQKFDLLPGFKNFAQVNAGDQLGIMDERTLLAPHSGLMLFPKYLKQQNQSLSAEVYRLLKPISLQDLP